MLYHPHSPNPHPTANPVLRAETSVSSSTCRLNIRQRTLFAFALFFLLTYTVSNVHVLEPRKQCVVRDEKCARRSVLHTHNSVYITWAVLDRSPTHTPAVNPLAFLYRRRRDPSCRVVVC